MPLGSGKKPKGSKPSRRTPRAGGDRSKGISKGGALRQRQVVQRRQRQAERAVSRAQRPLPRPAQRSVMPPVFPGVPSRPAVDNIAQRLQSVQNQYLQLDRASKLEDVYQELGRIEEMFTQLPATLDSLRRRGYVHSGHLEDQLEALDDEWDTVVRPNVDRQLRENIFRLDRQLEGIDRTINQMSRPSDQLLGQAESALQSAQQAISTVRSSTTSLFQGTLSGLGAVKQQVHQAEWMMEQLEQAKDFSLLEAEGPLLAVEAEWEEDGADEGPDGILYLTDQRLIFEQKEEVATKKFLFITTESEVVQKLLIEVPVRDIQEIVSDEEGRGFLNMRKDDILGLIFTASAPLSRARFHIRGRDSAEWETMIKRVQAGDVDQDRAEAFLEEVEEATEKTATLPDKCPSCFAAVPPQARGVTSVVCEFCGSTISGRAE